MTAESRAVEYTSRYRYGIRREDGQPWRTEPRHEGDTGWYARGEETSTDGLVMVTNDVLDLAAMMMSQNGDDEVPHPGRVIAVRTEWDGQGHYVYRDWPPGLLATYIDLTAREQTGLRAYAETLRAGAEQ